MRVAAAAIFFVLSLAFSAPAGAVDAAATAEARLARAFAAYLGNDFVTALGLAKAAAAERPNDGAILHLLGLCQLRIGEPSEALLALQRARRAGAAGPDFDFDYGVALLQSGSLPAAGDAFDAVLADRPEAPLVHYYRGYVDYRLQRYASASEHFARSREDSELATPSDYYRAIIALEADPANAEAPVSNLQRVASDPAFPELARSAKEIAGAFSSRAPQRRFDLAVALGGAYDSNVLQLQLDSPVDEDAADGRFQLFVRAAYAPILEPRAQVRTGLDAWYSRHGQRGDFDLLRFGFHAESDFTLEATGDALALGVDLQHALWVTQERRSSLGYYGQLVEGRPHLRWNQHDDFALVAEYRLARTFFATDTDAEDRAGLSHAAALRQFWLPTDTIGVHLNFEYLVERDSAGPFFVTRPGGRGFGGGLGADFRPVGDVTLAVGGWLRHLDYGGLRDDDIVDLEARIAVPVGGGFGAMLSYRWRRNFSADPAHDFGRQVAGLMMTWERQ